MTTLASSEAAVLVQEIRDDYNVSLPLFEGAFEDAKREAQSKARYLILYLHSPAHENTATFVNDVLGNALLSTFVEDQGLLFAASVDTPAGHRIAHDLNVRGFPYLGFFLKQDKVLEVEGLIGVEDLMREVHVMQENWGGVLATEIAFKTDREERERIRLSEERAAGEAERIDRERLRLFEEKEREAGAAREAAAQAARAAEEEERRAKEEQEREAERERLATLEKEMHAANVRETARARLLPEPDEPEGGEVVSVSIRSLVGAAFQRRFLRSSPATSLYDYAETLPDYDGSAFDLLVGFPVQTVSRTTTETVGTVVGPSRRVVVRMRSSVEH